MYSIFVTLKQLAIFRLFGKLWIDF